jgi:iron(III) transport system substrate-binding protein
MKRLTFLLLTLIVSPVLAADPSSWEQDWNRIFSAAKKEGKVSVTGPGDAEARSALVDLFEKKYGIAVDFFGSSGRELAPRILTERRAGRYLWDVYVSGTTTALGVMIPQRAFEALEPQLLLPDVKDPRTWRGEAQEFVDPGRTLLVTARGHRATLAINPKLAKPEDFKSYRDLLNPKWKGKFIIDDPRRAGPGQATFTFLYLHPELGPGYIRALARQEPVILRDYLQEVDFVGQGRYPALLGGFDVVVENRMKQGAAIMIVDPRQLREGSDVSSSNGAIALYKNAPHPNAARIYINWLLSQEGQAQFVRRLGYVSARKDVPTDHVPPWRVPQPGAIATYTEEAQRAKDSLLPLLTEVFGR